MNYPTLMFAALAGALPERQSTLHVFRGMDRDLMPIGHDRIARREQIRQVMAGKQNEAKGKK
jgi:hypothetical protein